jgi:AraC-like DNA-binding protein
MSPAEQMVFLEKIYSSQSMFSHFSIALYLLQAFIYLILCLHLLVVHIQKIKQTFSAIERINLSWIRHLIFLFILIWVIVLGLQAFLPKHLLIENLDDAVTYFLIALFIFIIGYRGMSQPEIFSGLTGETSLNGESARGKKYKKTGLSLQKGKLMKEQLLRLMKEKRPYLDSGLTLPQVADMMGVPPHQLSQVINESMEQNFYQLVNQYRLEEARRRLSHPDINKDKLLKIAFDSGFNSLPTFNRVFKNLTGESPSAYRKSKISLRNKHI